MRKRSVQNIQNIGKKEIAIPVTITTTSAAMRDGLRPYQSEMCAKRKHPTSIPHIRQPWANASIQFWSHTASHWKKQIRLLHS